MNQNKINEWIEKQKKIQQQIIRLVEQVDDITTQIQLLNNFQPKTTSDAKKEVKELILNKGYQIQSKKQFGTDTLIITKGSSTKSLIIKHSKYHNHKDYQAWYTLNPEVENFIDFFVFTYLTKDYQSNCVVLNKSDMIIILKQLKKLPDGIININLRVKSDGRVIESSSNTDLSKFVNNFHFI